MTEGCIHMKDFVKMQLERLQIEFNFNEVVLAENGKDKMDAEGDYLAKYYPSWVTGMGDAYCCLICFEISCQARNVRFGNLKKKVLEYQSFLRKKDQEEVSFAKAWEQYLFTLGPSFWKGVADAVSPRFLKSMDLVSEDFLKTLDEI